MFSYSCPHFSPITLPCPTHPHLPHSIPPYPPLSLSTGPLPMFLDWTLPLLSPVIPLPPPLWSFFQIIYIHVSQVPGTTSMARAAAQRSTLSVQTEGSTVLYVACPCLTFSLLFCRLGFWVLYIKMTTTGSLQKTQTLNSAVG